MIACLKGVHFKLAWPSFGGEFRLSDLDGFGGLSRTFPSPEKICPLSDTRRLASRTASD